MPCYPYIPTKEFINIYVHIYESSCSFYVFLFLFFLSALFDPHGASMGRAKSCAWVPWLWCTVLLKGPFTGLFTGLRNRLRKDWIKGLAQPCYVTGPFTGHIKRLIKGLINVWIMAQGHAIGRSMGHAQGCARPVLDLLSGQGHPLGRLDPAFAETVTMYSRTHRWK